MAIGIGLSQAHDAYDYRSKSFRSRVTSNGQLNEVLAV